MKAERRNALRDAVVLVKEMSVSLNAALLGRFDEGLMSNSAVVILIGLQERGPLRPRELMTLSGLTSAGVSGALTRLESLDYIHRARGAVDGDQRGVEVALTPHGESVTSELTEAVADEFRNAAESVKDLERLLGGAVAERRGNAPTGARPTWADAIMTAARCGLAVSESIAAASPPQFPLGNAELVALGLIDEATTCRPGYLGDRLGLSSGGVTRLIDRLEAAGLCQRSYGASAADRRAVLVSITDEGSATVTAAMERVGEHGAILVEFATMVATLLAERR